MANNAKISLYGTVITEPKMKTVNNSQVMTLKVGVMTTKKQEGSQFPVSDIYDVNIWGKKADALVGKAKSKAKVWVTGSFQTGEQWTDRNGKINIPLHVMADDVRVVSGGGEYKPNNYNNNAPDEDAEEEELF